MKHIAIALAVLVTPSVAQAGDSCQSAKDMVRMAKAFYAPDADHVNIITPTANLRMTGLNGAPDPDGIHYFHDGTHDILPVDDNQVVQNIETAANWSKDGKLCRFVDGKIPEATDEDTVQVQMHFGFVFKETPAELSVATIREGLKDGSKVMNGVAPGGLGFAVPGLKTIIVGAPKDAPKPVVSFVRKGKGVPVRIVTLNGNQYIRWKDIKSAKADHMRVAGDYDLSGFFKIDPDEMEAAEAKRLAETATP